jgi:hypothetical protein
MEAETAAAVMGAPAAALREAMLKEIKLSMSVGEAYGLKAFLTANVSEREYDALVEHLRQFRTDEDLDILLQKLETLNEKADEWGRRHPDGGGVSQSGEDHQEAKQE